jgi:hypothetical protein
MNRFQDYAADATRRAAEEAFKYAKAVPADKVNWKAADTGKSVLEICRELAWTPTWAIDTIEGKEFDHSDAAMAKMKETEARWTTVVDCETECNRVLDKLEALYRSVSDERLKTTRFLPYDGGRDFTVEEMLEYARWNFTYHLGQIAYIQTLYGDKNMH